MTRQLLPMVLLVSAMVSSSASVRAALSVNQTSTRQDHIAWVAEALKRMQSVTTGMTRDDLLQIFTTEGGISNGLRRTFVSRDCPYFKVDVEFKAVGRPERDSESRVTLVEGNQDTIVRISRPYLQFSVVD